MIISNERAFLSMLSVSEGTDAAPDPYAVCYSYKHEIKSFADHPAITGEWSGEPLPEAMCRAAGYSSGCKSTAAGRYQIIRSTWIRCRDHLHLPNFGPDCQDRAALLLITWRKALTDVHNGNFKEAVRKCAPEWASLPGSGYGQPERKLAVLADAFIKAGGVLAS